MRWTRTVASPNFHVNFQNACSTKHLISIIFSIITLLFRLAPHTEFNLFGKSLFSNSNWSFFQISQAEVSSITCLTTTSEMLRIDVVVAISSIVYFFSIVVFSGKVLESSRAFEDFCAVSIVLIFSAQRTKSPIPIKYFLTFVLCWCYWRMNLVSFSVLLLCRLSY